MDAARFEVTNFAGRAHACSDFIAVEPQTRETASPLRQAYWGVIDPLELSDPVAGSLTDDVRDIYSDVMRRLRSYDNPDCSWEPAVWEWRFRLQHHWSDHALDALRALQRAMHREP
jgi:hypothetical protein